ncbi:vanin-like protein 1 [Solenopsis invicta]|uniref:vanin-like protein 1 n=1 Tax=Solenopsis invicta TaxID=13686 RepID=UPI00193DA63F|nr:vanin-like protein 1 [Solenopsis invicta]
MGQHWISFYLLVVCVHLSYQRSIPNATTYRAAVVEYPSRSLTNSSDTMNENSDVYVRFITTAARDNVDIIVFPEDGLTTSSLPGRDKMGDWTTVIPSASDNCTPCYENTMEISEILKKISCAASNNEIYVVINIAEKVTCTSEPCPKDKVFYYNTNVVFDRTGKIIAKYRKTNLFVTEVNKFDVTKIPEIVTFDTDFGVKFGTFICFDILFDEPALNLTRDFQVTDIVYPTAWHSEVPFLTAIQTQAGWSFAEDVNLLAAGYNRPNVGHVGSGIYLGRKGIGKAIMPTTGHEEMLIFEVPKIKKETRYRTNHDHLDVKEQEAKLYYHRKKNVNDELLKKWEDNTITDDKILLLHEDLSNYYTYPLEKNITELSLCASDFCCNFKVEIIKVDSNTKYRLAVFNGIRRYFTIEANLSVCGIIQCSNDSVSSCGSLQESEVVFGNIEIEATFENYENILIMPSTLNSNLLPLKNWTFYELTRDDYVSLKYVSMSLKNNINNLVTFGIFSRNFNTENANKASFYNVT